MFYIVRNVSHYRSMLWLQASNLRIIHKLSYYSRKISIIFILFSIILIQLWWCRFLVSIHTNFL